jgi:hypothetical protein
MHLSGTVAPGYSADYGNMTASDHAWTVGGTGTLSGAYHSPNFLSFNLAFYLNQSRTNSSFQSISNASGLDLTSSIFGGSHFPGSVSYSLAYNSEGSYNIPGIANYVTHGNSDNFGVSWGENLPKVPSFSASYQLGNSRYSVYGTNDEGANAFHSLNLHSSYRLANFGLGAYYSSGGGHSDIPLVLQTQGITQTTTDSSAYGVSASHPLPLNGSISGGWNRSTWDSAYSGNDSTGTVDILNATASLHPATKVSVSTSVSYSDNLSGQLEEAVVQAGGVLPGANTSESSNSLDLEASLGYTPTPDLQLAALAERRQQSYLGQIYGLSSFGGSASYSHEFLHGQFSAAVMSTDNTSDQTDENTVSFSASGNYTTHIRSWQVSARGSYAQNMQTLLVTYMNSSYNFSGNVRRSWGKLTMGGAASGARTGLTQEPGTVSSSEGYSGTIGYSPFIAASASYSRSSGQAITTGAGLVPVPIPNPVIPSSFLTIYGGNGYSFSVSSNPVKKLILSSSYSNATSNTASGGLASSNQSSQFSSLIQYQTRQLFYTSGYARLVQGFSNSGSPAQVVSSYSIGVSRWFNVF